MHNGNTLNNIAQRRQDYGHPTCVACVYLQAAFDSLSFGFC